MRGEITVSFDGAEDFALFIREESDRLGVSCREVLSCIAYPVEWGTPTAIVTRAEALVAFDIEPAQLSAFEGE